MCLLESLVLMFSPPIVYIFTSEIKFGIVHQTKTVLTSSSQEILLQFIYNTEFILFEFHICIFMVLK